MHIIVNCPDCSRQLRLPRETLGTTVRCPLCKSVFMTRPTATGAEAIRVAPKSASAPPPAPPPPRQGDDFAPLRLELEDPRPAAPPPLPPKETYGLAEMEALPADDPDDPDYRPRRRARDEDDDRDREPPRRPARRDRDEDEEEEEEDQPRRRRSGPAFATFKLFVHHDPSERLNGTFDAEVGPDGVAMWRGRGRVLEVPVGAPVERTGLGRLRLEVDGRRVEVGVIDPEEQHDELAEEVVDYLKKKSDAVQPPRRKVGPVVWMALVPLVIPLLALGFGHAIAGVGGMVVWLLLAVALGGLCLPIVMQRRWTPGGRAAGALGVSSFGLFVLLIAMAFDSGPPPPPLDQQPWRPFAPTDSGYRVELPGHPAGYKTTRFSMPGGVGTVHELDLPAYGTWFFVGHGEPFGGQQAPATILSQARNDLSSRYIGGAVRTDNAVTVSGNSGREVHVHTSDGYDVVARMVAVQGRLIVAMAVTNQLKPDGPEVRKFLDSLALDPTTGWPSRVAGGPDVKPPEGEKKDDALTDGGKVVYSPDRHVAWAGFSKDGKTFAAVTVAGAVVRFDAAGNVLGRGKVDIGEEQVAHAALSNDGQTLYVGCSKSTIYTVHLGTMQSSATFRNVQRPVLTAVAVSSDGKRVASARSMGGVGIWSAGPGGQPEPALKASDEMPLSVAFSDDGALLAVGDAGGVARVFDATTRARRAELRGHDPRGARFGDFSDAKYALPALAFARDGRTLVTVGNDRTARVWDVAGQKQRHQLFHDDPVTAVTFHPAGRLFATGTSNGEVCVYESAGGQLRGGTWRRTNTGALPAGGAVRHLSFSADGKQLLVALTTRVEQWELERRVTVMAEDRKPLPLLPRNLTRVEAGTEGFGSVGPMVVRADGSLLAITGRRGQLGVYDATTLALKHGAEMGTTVALAVHPTEGLVACGVNNNVQLRDTATATNRVLHGSSWQNVRSLAFSPDGKRLAVGHTNGTASSDLRVWDPATLTVVHARAQAGGVTGIAYSPDGVALVTASEGDNYLRLWEAATGRECARLRGHTSTTLCVAYSPDGKWIASGGRDKSARLWGAARGRVAFALTGHDNAVTCIAFSPDSKTLATGSDDKEVKLWDVPSGQLLHTLKHEGAITGVGFGAKGEALFVRASDASLNRWDLTGVSELKKRPEPVTPDYDKADPPLAPDLQPGAPIAPHTALVIAPKEGVALAFTRDRLLLRYSYPDFALKGVSWTGLAVYKAILDPARGLVYAAVSDVRKFKHAPPNDLYEGEGDLAILDIKALLAGKDTPRVTALATVAIDAKVGAMALSADGKWLTYLDVKNWAREMAGRIDTTTRKTAGTVSIKGVQLKGLAPSSDGKRLYLFGVRNVPGANKGVFVPLDAATGKLGKEVESTAVPTDAVVVGNHALVTPLFGAGVTFVDLTTGLPRTWTMFGSRMARVSPDGKRVYLFVRIGVRDVQAFDLPAKRPGAMPAATAKYDETLAAYNSSEWVMAPDGKCLVAPTGRVLRLAGADVQMPKASPAAPARPDGKLRELPPYADRHDNRLLAVAYSPDNKWMVSASSDRWLVVRRMTGLVTWSRSHDSGEPYALAVAPGGARWAMASLSGRGATFIPPRHDFSRFVTSHPAGVDTIAYTADGKRLLVANDRGLANLKAEHSDPGFGDAVIEAPALTGIATAPDAPPAAGGLDGKVRLFDLDGAKVKETIKAHDGEVRCVAYSPDGKYLASGGIDGKVKVWSPEGKALHSLDAHGSAVLCLVFAADGKTLASGAADGSLKLWDAAVGKEKVALPPRPERPVYCLAFAPDGKVLAGGSGPEVTRWDTAAHVGTPLKPVPIDETPKVPPPDRRPVEIGRIPGITDAAIDVKGGSAYAVLPSGGTIAHYAYPAMTIKGVYRVDTRVYRLAVDAKGDKLYALRSGRVTPTTNGVQGEDAELLVFDARDLKGGVGKKVVTAKPANRLKLEGTVSQMTISPDGKALYYLDVKGKRLGRVDTATVKRDGEADLDGEPAAMALTPDGKLLYAVTSKGTAGQLEVFGAGLRALRRHKLTLKADEVIATSDRLVWVAGAQGANKVDVLYDEADGLKEVRRQRGNESLALRLTADGRGVFLVPRKKAPLDVIYFPLGKDRKPGVGTLLPITAVRAQGTTVVVAPDGKHLLLAGGAFRLPALPAPKP